MVICWPAMAICWPAMDICWPAMVICWVARVIDPGPPELIGKEPDVGAKDVVGKEPEDAGVEEKAPDVIGETDEAGGGGFIADGAGES